jgi:mutator protein MutT
MTLTDESKVVIAAVIMRGNHYLICKRPEHKRHGGLWEFPGGKLEPSETFLEAATRELKEELDLTVVQIGEVLLVVSDNGTSSDTERDSSFLVNFLQVETAGDPVLLEHQELRWLSSKQLRILPLAPSDRCFVEHLNNNCQTTSRLISKTDQLQTHLKEIEAKIKPEP